MFKMVDCKISFGSEIEDISRIIREEFANDLCDGFISVGEEETVMPKYYANYAESIKNLKVRNSDVFVCSYPKTGTTWTKEMVWLIANDLDYEGAKSNLLERVPFLEYCTLFDFQHLDKVMGVKSPRFARDSLQFVEQLPNPRFITTHLPFSLLPQDIKSGCKTPKIIYVLRNPKDACVSFYHHGEIIQGWKTNLENFAKVFMANKIIWGSFWKHVFGYWNQRTLSNLLIISYEDMKKDLASVVRKVAIFLGKSYKEDQIKQLCEHLSFESMRNNNAVNLEAVLAIKRGKKMISEDQRFIRAGVVGKYKEEMSPELIKQFDAWIEENVARTSFAEKYKFT